MDYPFKAVTVVTTNAAATPMEQIPRYTVFDVVSRLGNTHVYKAYVDGNPSTEYYIHISGFIILEPETDPQLYRRAVARKGPGVDQDYYTTAYNSPIAWQLRQRDLELKFCLTSEDALLKAVEWENAYNETEAVGAKLRAGRMVPEYIRYAEILEKFERVIDQFHTEQLKANQKEQINAR